MVEKSYDSGSAEPESCNPISVLPSATQSWYLLESLREAAAPLLVVDIVAKTSHPIVVLLPRRWSTKPILKPRILTWCQIPTSHVYQTSRLDVWWTATAEHGRKRALPVHPSCVLLPLWSLAQEMTPLSTQSPETQAPSVIPSSLSPSTFSCLPDPMILPS